MENKYLFGGFYGLVYFLEGMLITYFTGFNILYMRTFGLSFTSIGLISSVVLIPFVLKIFIGLFSDSVNLFGLGHRKPLIFFGLLLEGGMVVFVPFLSPVTGLVSFTALLFAVAFGMSMFDTATDGLALDTTPENLRGFVQGLMVGGRSVGAVIAAVSIGYITHYWGWKPVFWGIGAVTLLPLAWFAMLPAEGARPAQREFHLSAFKSFISWPVAFLVLVGFLYTLAIYSVEGIVNAFLKEGLGITMLNVGFITAIFGIGTAVGAALGGTFLDRIGHKPSLFAALIFSTVTILLIAATSGLSVAYVLLFQIGRAHV